MPVMAISTAHHGVAIAKAIITKTKAPANNETVKLESLGTLDSFALKKRIIPARS